MQLMLLLYYYFLYIRLNVFPNWTTLQVGISLSLLTIH